MKKTINISAYLGYTVSLITTVAGGIIISGFVFEYVPIKMRVAFGVVLILWGVYRFVLTRSKAREEQQEIQENQKTEEE
jgi:cytochrome c biogenesis protein CcdA